MIGIGDRLPEAKLLWKGAEGPQEVRLCERLKGRKVVIFAVPGAFTPTCDSAHMPSFIRNAEQAPTPQNQKILPARKGRLNKAVERMAQLNADLDALALEYDEEDRVLEGYFIAKARHTNNDPTLLGKHSLTGLFEERTNDNRNRQVRGSWWSDSGKWPGSPDISSGLSDNFRRIVKSQVYLGDDFRGVTDASQIRLDGPIMTPFPQIGDTYGIWYFDNKLKTDVKDTGPFGKEAGQGGKQERC